MNRYKHRKFDPEELHGKDQEGRNRLIFDWWCDETNRPLYIAYLGRKVSFIPSRSPLLLDPAPPLNVPAPLGFREIALISDPEHIRQVLTDTANFGNAPYAALGGASFLLAIDPLASDAPGTDWHHEQNMLVRASVDHYKAPGLRTLARRAVDEAALTSLASADFDLAAFAEQACLRYFGTLFGYGFQDHPLLEDAARATYRALQYLAVGQHFVTEPSTLPAAQQALSRLVSRSSQLMEDYTRLQHAPRRFGWEPARSWPDGVQPWSENGLADSLGEPLLQRLPALPGPLSGRDRATIVATLLAGTLGNVQSAVCLLMQKLLNGELEALNDLKNRRDDDSLESALEAHLAGLPPIPVMPRRVRNSVTVGKETLAPDTDCLLLLEGQPGCPHAHTQGACRRIWGGVAPPQTAPHECLGRQLALPLIAALLRHTLRLPGLTASLDALTGEVLPVEKLWGFACTHYPLRFERERVRKQQNLIVAMHIKSPVSENAARLRRVLAAGAPRIEAVLNGFGGLHFAWFEFSEDERQLVLRTVYDGQLEAYLKYFALRAGDLFDALFEYLEEAPPRPVAEFPQEFIAAVRARNRGPALGYLYSAYPQAGAAQIRGLGPRS